MILKIKIFASRAIRACTPHVCISKFADIFWNLIHKKKFDQQQCAQFQKFLKSVKSLHPSVQQGWLFVLFLYPEVQESPDIEVPFLDVSTQ